ncbi:hypothetical protein [Paenibacillus piscarius]|uniref:hypothetical protein n=1 Tax=Paenibacillus piscarius TaxID=1089681 RepID=UPI001EE94C51|nr:hypothetical protein [Paenibacillus piscarius]
MYDYISIHSMDYAQSVRTEVLERFVVGTLGFEQTGPLQFTKALHGAHVGLKGIAANADGSYAYYTLEGVEAVNLVEVILPAMIDEPLERAMTGLVMAIVDEFGWCIDEDHGLDS